MQVVIIAGGLATRLRPMTFLTPKSMIEIEGKPFIEYQIINLKRQGISDVVICVGHMGGKIEAYLGSGSNYGVNIIYRYDRGYPMGTAGALKNANDVLGDPFFTIYGDSYISIDFAKAKRRFDRSNKPVMMTVFKNCDRFDRSNVVVENDLVKVYDKQNKHENMDYIDYGALILRKGVLDLVPGGQPYSLEELLMPMVERKQVLAFKVSERFYEIGSIRGISEFAQYIRDRKDL
jgi:N-acetyl-alpha-D-muramate 1-phosphate uridylyltransferase